MSKFCAKCGNILADDALFCTKCGSAQQPPVQPMNQPPINQTPVAPNGYMPQQPPMAQSDYMPQQPPMNQPPVAPNSYMPQQQPTMPQAEPTQPAKKSNKPLIIGIIIALIVALTVVTILLVTQSSSSGKSSHSGGSSSSSGSGNSGVKPVTAESVVREYMEAFGNSDAEALVNCMCYDVWFDGVIDKDDCIEELEDWFDDAEIEDFEYEIKSVDDLSDSEIKDLEELFDYIEEDSNSFDADKVTDYKMVKVKVSYDAAWGDYNETEEFCLIKYKGQWTIIDFFSKITNL